MNTKFSGLFLTALLALTSGLGTGCVNTVDDRTRLGVPFIKDSVEGNYPRTVAQVYQAARAVLKYNNAEMISDNSVNNSLEARLSHERVWIRVEEVDAAKPITRVVVQTRTISGASDLDLAHEVEKQIALQLVR